MNDKPDFTMGHADMPGRKSKWRPTDDHYNTPREASVPFIRTAQLPDQIWEPCAGEGALSQVLIEHGHQVISTTLVDRGYGTPGRNFLLEKTLLAPAIVTNPPFVILDEVILHALSLNPDYLAILCKTRVIETADRYRDILSRRPPSIIYQFIERITFFAGDIPEEDQPGWNTEMFCWAVWIKNWRREPVIRWLTRDDGLQGMLSL